MIKRYDIAIIGGGIIGANIAYELSKYKNKIILLEKNISFGEETSKNNSGVIHCGFDAESHKIEAKLNVLGNKLWQKEIFPKIKFKRQKVDSLVIAFNKEEEKHLNLLYERGLKNKVNPLHLSILDKKQTLEKEKFLNKDVTSSLLCTNSWAIDPYEATNKIIEKSIENGLKTSLDFEVKKIDFKNSIFSIYSQKDEIIHAKIIINAAGHYADEIAKLANYSDFQQTTRRGEYIVLSNNISSKVTNICFMVPTIHGKGVIVAPMTNGNYLVGPSAENDVPKNTTSYITKEKYEQIVKIGNIIIPNLETEKIVSRFAGSRPIEIKSNDFYIKAAKENKNFINAAGMQSPGLSSAPAIAKMIIKLINKSDLKLKK
ncbi:type 2 glycerol-3-phosphate oxidase [[Mycoplasma] collis]|uniref:type 2 glycerol-3-phosphate oxidase n=1 Tax=[Mycoplasma] collis TaxID=2127 RepID=UPI000690D3A3|nr:type 2 glycerol-3-phosphate oxidase [[Mycoplasma] collis]